MKTYKFNFLETLDIYISLTYACTAAKQELEDDIKLDAQMSCKSIVERDKAIYATLCRLREIARQHTNIKIVGD